MHIPVPIRHAKRSNSFCPRVLLCGVFFHLAAFYLDLCDPPTDKTHTHPHFRITRHRHSIWIIIERDDDSWCCCTREKLSLKWQWLVKALKALNFKSHDRFSSPSLFAIFLWQQNVADSPVSSQAWKK